MNINKSTLIIIIQSIAIAALVSTLLYTNNTTKEEDPYIKKLKDQNKELTRQIARLKNNFVNIGLADSIESRSIDSLISASNRKIDSLKNESKEYWAAVIGHSDKEWEKLSDEQKQKEINEAINFLKNNNE